jgi:hypothetical protein
MTDQHRNLETRAIPGENLALFALSLFFVYVWITGTHSSIIQIQDLVNFPLALLLFSFASIAIGYSIVLFVRGRASREEIASETSYIVDKIKLAWLCIVSGLLLSAAFAYAVLIVLLMSALVILQAFHADLKYMLPKTIPWKYGLVNALLYLLTGIGIVALLNMGISMSSWTESLGTLILPLSIILSILSIGGGIAGYLDQRDRLHGRRKGSTDGRQIER